MAFSRGARRARKAALADGGIHSLMGIPEGGATNRLDYALLLGSKYVSL
jgi:hypothetical protein